MKKERSTEKTAAARAAGGRPISWGEMRSVQRELERACLGDRSRASPGMTSRIERAARQLAATGATARDVEAFTVRYVRKRGRRPSPEIVVDGLEAAA